MFDNNSDYALNKKDKDSIIICFTSSKAQR